VYYFYSTEQTPSQSVTTVGFVTALCIGKPQLEILMLSNIKGFEADFTARKNETSVQFLLKLEILM
jgi:hypothetical protein